jgi:hypothetical protein
MKVNMDKITVIDLLCLTAFICAVIAIAKPTWPGVLGAAVILITVALLIIRHGSKVIVASAMLLLASTAMAQPSVKLVTNTMPLLTTNTVVSTQTVTTVFAVPPTGPVVPIASDTNGVPLGIPGITGILGTINETATNLFGAGEIELRLGGVYVQTTGEGGTLIAAEKWDIFKDGVGIGGETIQSGQNNAAEFMYVAYRKLIGNTAGIGFLGGGYDAINKHAMGVVGLRVERRTNKHLGIWASVSYGIEPKGANSRGMVVGGGISYAL